jgi:fatty-acyl-CoA synthase
MATLAATLQFDDPDQHPVHQRHHRPPKGATLTHHNILNNGYFVGEAMR